MFWRTAASIWNQDDQDSSIWLNADLWRTSGPEREQNTRSTSDKLTRRWSGTGETWVGATDPHNGVKDSRTQVHISRGEAGFGFTIFCDSPVRVQSVDAGGPAEHSGLVQGDVILQLNGLCVDLWSCADVAKTIRSCLSQVHMVVRRRAGSQPLFEDETGTSGVVSSWSSWVNARTDRNPDCWWVLGARCHTLPRTIGSWYTSSLPANHVALATNTFRLPAVIQAHPTAPHCKVGHQAPLPASPTSFVFTPPLVPPPGPSSSTSE